MSFQILIEGTIFGREFDKVMVALWSSSSHRLWNANPLNLRTAATIEMTKRMTGSNLDFILFISLFMSRFIKN